MGSICYPLPRRSPDAPASRDKASMLKAGYRCFVRRGIEQVDTKSKGINHYPIATGIILMKSDLKTVLAIAPYSALVTVASGLLAVPALRAEQANGSFDLAPVNLICFSLGIAGMVVGLVGFKKKFGNLTIR
jgi:hypothetical protein